MTLSPTARRLPPPTRCGSSAGRPRTTRRPGTRRSTATGRSTGEAAPRAHASRPTIPPPRMPSGPPGRVLINCACYIDPRIRARLVRCVCVCCSTYIDPRIRARLVRCVCVCLLFRSKGSPGIMVEMYHGPCQWANRTAPVARARTHTHAHSTHTAHTQHTHTHTHAHTPHHGRLACPRQRARVAACQHACRRSFAGLSPACIQFPL